MTLNEKNYGPNVHAHWRRDSCDTFGKLCVPTSVWKAFIFCKWTGTILCIVTHYFDHFEYMEVVIFRICAMLLKYNNNNKCFHTDVIWKKITFWKLLSNMMPLGYHFHLWEELFEKMHRILKEIPGDLIWIEQEVFFFLLFIVFVCLFFSPFE